MGDFLLTNCGNGSSTHTSVKSDYGSSNGYTNTFEIQGDENYRLSFNGIDENFISPFYQSQTGNILFCNGITRVGEIRVDKYPDQFLKKWQKFGDDILESFSGYGNLLIWNKELKEWTLITSRMGFLPIFIGEDSETGEKAIGNHPDKIASFLKMDRLNKISIAEFIATGSITPPFTYYEDIIQLEPASIYRFDKKGLHHVKKFWLPDLEHDNFLSEEDSISYLAEIISTTVNQIINESDGKGLLLLSGGMDSRAVLLSPDNPSAVFKGTTFYTEENIELKQAAQLAGIAGIEHYPLNREYDYYAKLAVDSVKITGGMWNFASCHAYGFKNELSRINPGVMLSGMYFDTFFKGFAFTKKESYAKFSGKIKKEYSDQDIYWDTKGSSDLKNEWSEKVHERRLNYYGFDVISSDNLTPQTLNKIKYRRIKNLSRWRSGGMDNVLYKTQNYDLVSSGLKFSEVFNFLNPKHEIKHDFMSRVLRKITTQKLPADANIESSHFLYQNFYITVIYNVLKKRVPWLEIRNKREGSIALETSWINWDNYRKESEMIKKLWNECDESAGELVTELLGYNPYKLSPDLSESKYEFINLLTVGLWLKYGYKA